jgi:hypothetical protein
VTQHHNPKGFHAPYGDVIGKFIIMGKVGHGWLHSLTYLIGKLKRLQMHMEWGFYGDLRVENLSRLISIIGFLVTR